MKIGLGKFGSFGTALVLSLGIGTSASAIAGNRMEKPEVAVQLHEEDEETGGAAAALHLDIAEDGSALATLTLDPAADVVDLVIDSATDAFELPVETAAGVFEAEAPASGGGCHQVIADLTLAEREEHERSSEHYEAEEHPLHLSLSASVCAAAVVPAPAPPAAPAAPGNIGPFILMTPPALPGGLL